MKAKQIFKIILFVVLFLGVVAYITYAMLDLSGGDPKEICTELSLVVEENPHADFIDAKQVEKMLQDANVYPKGKLMKDIDTRQIEQMLKADNFIESVECFKTNNGMEVGKGKVCVRVKQRTPVVYVLPDNAAGYYVDAEGTVISRCKYFEATVYDVKGETRIPMDSSKFTSIICMNGSGTLEFKGTKLDIESGGSLRPCSSCLSDRALRMETICK